MKKKNIVQRLSWIVLPFLYMGIMQYEVFGYDLLIRKHVLLGSVRVEIKDGIDLSRQDLTNARINLGLTELRNIDFSRADLTNADLRETKFRNCSFKGANLDGIYAHDARFGGCDFEDATISGAKNLCITQEQLRSTGNYKNRSLRGVELQLCDGFSGMDFSRFDLSNCTLIGDLTGCDFTNARISASVECIPSMSRCVGSLRRYSMCSNAVPPHKRL